MDTRKILNEKKNQSSNTEQKTSERYMTIEEMKRIGEQIVEIYRRAEDMDLPD